MAVYGTTGPDLLEGSDGADEIYGLDASDTITGHAGDDTLVGGPGIDHITVVTGGDKYLYGGDRLDQDAIVDRNGSDTFTMVFGNHAEQTSSHVFLHDQATSTDQIDTLVFETDAAGAIYNFSGDDNFYMWADAGAGAGPGRHPCPRDRRSKTLRGGVRIGAGRLM